MRVGFVQNNAKLLDVEGNVDRALRLIGNKRADLFVLPELFNTGYNFRNRQDAARVAEPIRAGNTTQALMGLSQRTGKYDCCWHRRTKRPKPLQFSGRRQRWQVLGHVSEGAFVLE